jgi:hypothetical protein
VTEDAYARAIEERRERSRAELRGPTSYLAAVARHALPVGSRLVFGPGADADVRLEGIARSVAVEATPDGFRVDGVPQAPGAVEAGRYTLRLSHQHAPAVVVLDRDAPGLREDVERRWYPVDPRLRVRAALEPDGTRVGIASTASQARAAERVGWLRFTVGGVPCRLAATRLLEPGVPDDHLEVFFRDATCGAGSYEMGRYVTVERDGAELVVDFNLAYNPACAFSPHYNCPVPPAENHLVVAVRAGEMAPRSSDARHG